VLSRVGFLWDSPAVFAEAIEAFRHGLRELGWIDGRNITIEYRWAEGRPERMRTQFDLHRGSQASDLYDSHHIHEPCGAN
jgi:hypothetical protein